MLHAIVLPAKKVSIEPFFRTWKSQNSKNVRFAGVFEECSVFLSGVLDDASFADDVDADFPRVLKLFFDLVGDIAR